MSLSVHRKAVQAAVKTGDRMEKLFRQMGYAEAPRGKVLSAYRTARQALKGNVKNGRIAQDVLDQLTYSTNAAARELLADAQKTGIEQAERSLELYSLPKGYYALPLLTSDGPEQIRLAQEAQKKRILAMILAGYATEETILGNGNQAGLLTPGSILKDLANWLMLVMISSWGAAIIGSLTRSGAKSDYYKQAVAAIDQKTTDCCLRVHGQTVRMDEDFDLTGEPRYADRLPNPPFHWWCRTAEALVHARDVEDELTWQMVHAAEAERSARERTGTREVIWPSHSRSGRS